MSEGKERAAAAASAPSTHDAALEAFTVAGVSGLVATARKACGESKHAAAWSYYLLAIATERALFEMRAVLSEDEWSHMRSLVDVHVRMMRATAEKLHGQRIEGAEIAAEALAAADLEA